MRARKVPTHPITERIAAKRQGAARHYGAHPYFTRRPWNVVQAYIEHFTREGDTVLDPFGGSGVTAIEALVLGRKAVHVDINPLANFVTRQIAKSPVSTAELSDAFQGVKRACDDKLCRWREMPAAYFQRRRVPHWYPKGVPLPRNADVECVEDLFTRKQLFALSLILHEIETVEDKTCRDLLRFCFSGTLAKCNRTFISARNRASSRGGATIFSVYRYHVPKSPVELDPWQQFADRFDNLLRCKRETNALIGGFYNEQTCRIVQGSAGDLKPVLPDASVDYVFTDPPYGGHIAYLDLSTMWNAWLRFAVTDSDKQNEAIEGGDLEHSRDHYLGLMRESISEMSRVLKRNRWLSMVFEHKDGTLYSELLRAAEAAGLEYVNTVSQSATVIWSMHKKKNPLRVLSGELILNFRKCRKGSSVRAKEARGDASAILLDVADAETQKRGGARTEDIYNGVMVRLLDSGLVFQKPLLLKDVVDDLCHHGYYFDRATGRWKKDGRASDKVVQQDLFR